MATSYSKLMAEKRLILDWVLEQEKAHAPVINYKINQLNEFHESFQTILRKALRQLFNYYEEYYKKLSLEGIQADNAHDWALRKSTYAKRRAIRRLQDCAKGNIFSNLELLKERFPKEEPIIKEKRRLFFRSPGISRETILTYTKYIFDLEAQALKELANLERNEETLFEELNNLIEKEKFKLNALKKQPLVDYQLLALEKLQKRYLEKIFLFDPLQFKMGLDSDTMNQTHSIKSILSMVPHGKKSFFSQATLYQKLEACITKYFPDLKKSYADANPDCPQWLHTP